MWPGKRPAEIHAHNRDLGLICPQASGGEAAWVAGLDVLAPASLLALINHFKGSQVLRPTAAKASGEWATSLRTIEP